MFDDLPADVQELSKELSEETGTETVAEESMPIKQAALFSAPSATSSTVVDQPDSEIAYTEVEFVEEESAEMMLDNFDIDVSVDVSLSDPDIGETEVFVSGLEDEQSDFPTSELPEPPKPTRRLFHDYKGRDVGEWKAEQERLARRNKNFSMGVSVLSCFGSNLHALFWFRRTVRTEVWSHYESGKTSEVEAMTDADLPDAVAGDGVGSQDGDKQDTEKAETASASEQASGERSSEESNAQQALRCCQRASIAGR